ncbi:hypothetical protein ACMFMF_002819 [Clarireedia jacksonii]
MSDFIRAVPAWSFLTQDGRETIIQLAKVRRLQEAGSVAAPKDGARDLIRRPKLIAYTSVRQNIPKLLAIAGLIVALIRAQILQSGTLLDQNIVAVMRRFCVITFKNKYTASHRELCSIIIAHSSANHGCHPFATARLLFDIFPDALNSPLDLDLYTASFKLLSANMGRIVWTSETDEDDLPEALNSIRANLWAPISLLPCITPSDELSRHTINSELPLDAFNSYAASNLHNNPPIEELAADKTFTQSEYSYFHPSIEEWNNSIARR